MDLTIALKKENGSAVNKHKHLAEKTANPSKIFQKIEEEPS